MSTSSTVLNSVSAAVCGAKKNKQKKANKQNGKHVASASVLSEVHTFTTRQSFHQPLHLLSGCPLLMTCLGKVMEKTKKKEKKKRFLFLRQRGDVDSCELLSSNACYSRQGENQIKTRESLQQISLCDSRRLNVI